MVINKWKIKHNGLKMVILKYSVLGAIWLSQTQGAPLTLKVFPCRNKFFAIIMCKCLNKNSIYMLLLNIESFAQALNLQL